MQLIRNILKDRLYGNTIWLIANSLMLSGLGFLFWMVITHLFSSEEVGIASTLIASIELLAMAGILGFDIAFLKYLPRLKRIGSAINTGYTLTGLAALCISLIFLLFQDVFLPRTDLLKQPLMALAFIIFVQATLYFTLTGSIFVAMRKMKQLFIMNASFSILKIILPFTLVGLGAFGILSSWMVGSGMAFLIGLFLFQHGVRPQVDKKTIRQFMGFSMTNYISNFLQRGPKWILPLIIAAAINPRSSAYFYVAWTIAAVLFMIPNSVAKTLLTSGKMRTAHLEIQVRKSLLFTFLILVPATIFVVVFADKILLLFGKEYSIEAARLLQLIAIASIPQAINTIAIAIHNIQHRMRHVLFINGSIAFLIIGLSAFTVSQSILMIGYAVLAAHSLTALYSLVTWRDNTKKAIVLARDIIKSNMAVLGVSFR